MNNSKLWLVVKPTVGIPLFLGAVAVGSFAVHVAVLTNTSWVGDFLTGQKMGSGDRAALESRIEPVSAEGKTVRFYSVSSGDAATGKDEMVVVLPDGRMGKAVFTKPVAMSSEGALQSTD